MPIFRRRWSTPATPAPATPAQASLALAGETADAVGPVVQAPAPAPAQASLALAGETADAVSPVVQAPAPAPAPAQASLALAVSPVVQTSAPVPVHEIKVNTIQAFFNSARAAMVAPAIPELVITEITPAPVSVIDTHEPVAPAPATKKAALYSFLNRRRA
jgi:hypothetical protein